MCSSIDSLGNECFKAMSNSLSFCVLLKVLDSSNAIPPNMELQCSILIYKQQNNILHFGV